MHHKIPVSYFAVFDGHGGYQCAQFLRDNLHLFLVQEFLKRKVQKNGKNGTLGKSSSIDTPSPGLLSFPASELLESEELAETMEECINEAF